MEKQSYFYAYKIVFPKLENASDYGAELAAHTHFSSSPDPTFLLLHTDPISTLSCFWFSQNGIY